jgi:Protein of unknown function (DUF3592)
MRLWGKVASGLLLIFAAVFAVVAFVVPESRWESVGAAVISIVAALYGVPALVRVFSSFTGDEEVLENGTPGVATITSLQPTGWRFNRYYPIVRFSLSVEAGGVGYPVEFKQAVDPELLQQLAPGVVVGVRVDQKSHKKVVIDWREPIHEATEAGGESAAQRTAESPATLDQPAKRSLWPFLRWAFLAFGLIFLRLSCEEGYFEKGGVRVQGVVLQKTYSPGTRSTGRSHRSSKHYVSYRFTTKEGRTIEGRYDVLPDTWEKLKESGPIVIEYLPDSPDTNRIPEQRARSNTFGIMALVLLVASAVLFIRGRRQLLAQAEPSGQTET